MNLKNHTYQAGISRQDVTPPVGIRLIGYAVREGVSHAVDEPLTLTALAIRGQNTTVIFVGIDIALMDIEFADKFRQACAKAVDIEASNIVVNFSHTHCAPAVGTFLNFDTEEQMALQGDFTKLLFAGGVKACQEAIGSLQPARMGVGWGECHGNINRRLKGPDGKVLLGEDPNGVCDHSVGVIRVDDLDGKPIAVAFRYSCHTVTVGPKTNVISPDFIGPARSLIENNLKCPSIFLQGCAGNSNPASGIGQLPDSDPDFTNEKIRSGQMLGGEVVKTAQNIRTHIERAEPKLVQSIAVYWLYENKLIPPGPEGSVRIDETRMNLPLKDFPPLHEVQQERAEWAAKLDEARNKNESEWIVNPLLRFDNQAQRRLEAAEKGNPHMVSFPIQVIALGELKIVSIPFEPMMETGLSLRKSLGGGDVFVLGYTNGSVAYLPTPKISAEGGMEARLGYKGYSLESEIPGDWKPKIKQRILNMFQS